MQLRSAYSNNRYCLDEYLERQLSSKSCRSITDRGGRRRDSGMARMGEDPGYDVDRAEPISSHLVGLCHAHDCPRVNVLYYVTAVALSVPQAGPEARV